MPSLATRLALACLCIAAVAGPAAAGPAAVEGDVALPGSTSPAPEARPTLQSNETPVGISLGPVRVVNVSLSEREITVGERTEIVVTVANVGDEPGNITVDVTAGMIPVGEETLRVEPGEERQLRFTFQPERRGEYLILANGHSPGVLVVNPPEETTVWDVAVRYAGWGAFVLGGAVLVCAVLVGAVAALRRDADADRPWLSTRTAKRLWVGGGGLLLLGVLVGGGLPLQGAIAGTLALAAYGLYAFVEVFYRSGR